MTFTFGSVCSGIGAAEYAWRKLGMDCAFMSEIDAFPRAVLKHRFPETPLHGDFTTIQAGDYRPVRLLVGGTPCQSFSIAGLRQGLADDRGNLALEYILLADRLRPAWICWENVPGVFSSKPGDPQDDGEDEEADERLGHNGGPVLDAADDAIPGEDFAAFLSGLVRWDVGIPPGGWKNGGVVSPAPVDGAYGVAWRVYDSQYFGVPQRRRRVFVVGYLGDWRPAAAVLLEPHSLSGDSPPRREPGARPARSLTRRTGSSGADAADALADHLVAGTLAGGGRADGGYSTDDIPLTVGALTSAHGPNGHGGSGLATDKGAEAGHILAWGGNNRSGPIEVAASLSANKTGSGQFYDFTVETFITEGAPIPFDTTQITHPENRSNPQPGDPAGTLAKDGHPPCIAFNSREDPISSEAVFGALSNSSPQAQAIAFAVRGRDEAGAVPEVHEDGQSVGALRAASGGSTRDMVATAYNFEHGLAPHGSLEGAEVVPALGLSEHKGHTAVHQAAAVRRLTPTECERLQAFPAIEMEVTIYRCSAPHERPAPAGSQNPRSQKPAPTAGAGASPAHARPADPSSSASPPGREKPAALDVRVNLERGEVLLQTREKCSSPASSAVNSASSRLPTGIDGFVHLAALIHSTAEAITRNGRVASPPSTTRSTVPLNGKLSVSWSGGETGAPADAAANDIAMAVQLSTSTTFAHELSSDTLRSILKTLCSYAADVITSFTPPEMFGGSLSVRLTTTIGYTATPWRGKPAPEVPDGPRYKSLGNSMTTFVVEDIGRQILEVDALLETLCGAAPHGEGRGEE